MYNALLSDFSPAAIAASGQCFRMRETAAGWSLIAGGRYLEIRPGDTPDAFVFSCTRAEFDAFWRAYFDLDTDYAPFRARCLKRDVYLQAACRYGAGRRILRQDPWETLVSFIISQRKSIPAIRRAVEELCRACGAPSPRGRRSTGLSPPRRRWCAPGRTGWRNAGAATGPAMSMTRPAEFTAANWTWRRWPTGPPINCGKH